MKESKVRVAPSHTGTTSEVLRKRKRPGLGLCFRILESEQIRFMQVVQRTPDEVKCSEM